MSGTPTLFDARGRHVMVTGSRRWKNHQALETALDSWVEKDDMLMHGGATGADVMAEKWAYRKGVAVACYLPDRAIPAPQRFHARNDQMLAKADLVIAFWDGESPGTRSVMDKAYYRRIPCIEVRSA